MMRRRSAGTPQTFTTQTSLHTLRTHIYWRRSAGFRQTFSNFIADLLRSLIRYQSNLGTSNIEATTKASSVNSITSVTISMPATEVTVFIGKPL